ncbi:MAG: response regulator, partial [Vallitaleaceae bacterium]|nr:response regulator [Vallitaleaceae bacterium]
MAKILIVDDSIVMRKNLAAILRQGGHSIIGEASNGRQAVSQYFDLEPDIVTMDIPMPILSGVEAVRQIIKIDADAKIIMISAVNQKKMVFSAI